MWAQVPLVGGMGQQICSWCIYFAGCAHTFYHVMWSNSNTISGRLSHLRSQFSEFLRGAWHRSEWGAPVVYAGTNRTHTFVSIHACT